MKISYLVFILIGLFKVSKASDHDKYQEQDFKKRTLQQTGFLDEKNNFETSLKKKNRLNHTDVADHALFVNDVDQKDKPKKRSMTKVTNFNTKSMFYTLPSELMEHILRGLNPLELIKICTTCHLFNNSAIGLCKNADIDLSETDINDKKLQQLLKQNYFLSFNFTFCNFSKTQIVILASSHITKLVLNHNDLQDNGIEPLLSNKTLKNLSLANVKITDKDAKAVLNMPHLETLSLAYNNLTDVCLADFLHTNTALTELDLSDNNLTNIAAQIVSQSLSLQIVNFALNSIDDDGADILFRSRLSIIRLTKNKLSDSKKQVLMNLIKNNQTKNIIL